VARIAALLSRIKGGIIHRPLSRASPLAVPALIEEGREWVAGGAEDALLAEAAALVAEATDGAEEFGETLADMTDGIITRGASARPKPRDKRRSRFIRSAPRRAS
jgi:ATP-dependent Lhr-like helicase